MARNTSFRQINQSAVFASGAKQQTTRDAALANALLDARHKCTVTETSVEQKKTEFDCENVFVDEILILRGSKQFSFVYESVSPEILAFWAAYFFGATAAATGASANESQTLAISNDADGTFLLKIDLEGREGKTYPISAANITAAIIKNAIIQKGSSIEQIIKNGDITVTDSGGGVFLITFAGRLRGADLPLLEIERTGNTAGTITITEQAAGDAKYIPFVRATADKPLFSFALVDITGVQPAEKFYNAVCGSFEPAITADGNINLTVGVECNYYPQIVTGFAIPPCLSYTGLTASDCRIQVDGRFETLDVFTESISLNDGLVADYGFDSFSPDIIDRGDQPTYSINGQIFGVKTDPFGILVTNREKAEFITHFGMPGHRFSVIAPAVILEAQNNPRQFGGTRNKALISFNGTPSRDGVNAPVRAEGIGVSDTAFLLTS